ncbi:polyphosphate kinase 2 family protein [Aureimonas mangrovi]|uniref:polyphosphate kinase 2 family protein n=1 Tax=Aureimonas mangrovi TaxID=2758041 RepID=UPI001FE95CE9|nr:polyphosphate kinase [Aureimonas mangrovi]
MHLAKLDYDATLAKKEYEERLDAVQTRFRRIQQAYLHTGNSAAIVFEGSDAAGKGGTIRRLSAVLDPRGFKVWPIAAPEPRDLRRHYLARFWEKLPITGEIAVFDRSWYGRVLVERIEGFAKDEQWRRAYREICGFEKTLVDAGTRIVKVYLAITAEAQFQRFEKRMNDPLKRWKLSYEDFRNRDRWDDYRVAAEEMFARTNSEEAPWHVVPANDKRYARVTALEAIAEHLARGVDLAPRPIDDAIEEQYRKMIEAHGAAHKR